MTKTSPPPPPHIRTEKHTVHGRQYEIRAVQTDEGASVEIFLKEKRLWVTSISAETMGDSKYSALPLTIETIIDIAKTELDQGNVK